MISSPILSGVTGVIKNHQSHRSDQYKKKNKSQQNKKNESAE